MAGASSISTSRSVGLGGGSCGLGGGGTGAVARDSGGATGITDGGDSPGSVPVGSDGLRSDGMAMPRSDGRANRPEGSLEPGAGNSGDGRGADDGGGAGSMA